MHPYDSQLRPPSNHCPTRKLFPNEPPHRTFINLRKADWDSYTREAEESFTLMGQSSSCNTGELLFRKILNISAKHHIPQDHIPNVIHPDCQARAP